jgi:hypothetical protein
LIIGYLAAIMAANLLVVQFGPSIAIVSAFLFIGLDLTTRDYLHEAWRGRWLCVNFPDLSPEATAKKYSRTVGIEKLRPINKMIEGKLQLQKG